MNTQFHLGFDGESIQILSNEFGNKSFSKSELQTMLKSTDDFARALIIKDALDTLTDAQINSNKSDPIASNFHKILENTDLPEGRCSVISIFVDNIQDAHQYAVDHPDRQIYWIEKQNMGVWYQHMRRVTDRLVWRGKP